MDVSNAFISLAISLGLGLLVGMQRERSRSRLGGIRTFALISVFGTVCALLAQSTGAWLIGVGLGGVAAATAIGNLFSLRTGGGSPGITTEIAMLATFVVGALLVEEHKEVAVVVGAGVAVLLYYKPMLHRVVRMLGDTDVRAIMQFALVTLVILPVVPDHTYEWPYHVLNLRNIWLMVALVVGMSLVGYLLYRFLNRSAGLALAGLLGGLISSTATTVSYARRAAQNASGQGVTASVAVIMIASSVVYPRVLTEVGVVSRTLLPAAAGPLGVAGGVSAAIAFLMWLRATRDGGDPGEQKNPTELKSALFFAGMYAAILLAVAAARANVGDAGLYAVSAISGLTDMDSITLSVSRLVEQGGLATGTAWRCILIAAMSNMGAKLVFVGVLGGRRLLRPLALLFGIKIVVTLGMVLLWPG